ncbi:MAG TPA: hypothetical protein VFX86_03660 [Candidatus Saccharimonadales bacterium]|nr:hypothetical protein [Candidatus Saccharimonadales bacterium]
MFELSGRQNDIERMIPLHHNRLPLPEERDHSLWAIRGILAVGFPEKRLLAANIGDLLDEEDEIEVHGSDIAAMLASARFGRLSGPGIPDVDVVFDTHEVEIMIPQEALQPMYADGMARAQAMNDALRHRAGQVGAAANGSSGIEMPVPMPAAA